MSGKTVAVRLSRGEIVLLTNSINEARNAIDDWEFQTRLGARPEEAEELRRKLKDILATLDASES